METFEKNVVLFLSGFDIMDKPILGHFAHVLPKESIPDPGFEYSALAGQNCCCREYRFWKKSAM